MGNEDKVEIQFKTTADNTGAKQAEQGVRNVTDAVKQAKPATDDCTDATEKLNVKKKDLIGNVKELSKHIPGLHSVLTLLKNPMVGLAVGIGMLADAIKNYFEKVNQAVENQRLAESLREQAVNIGSIRAELASASADFAQKFADAAEKGKRAADVYRDQADQLQRILDLQEKLSDAVLAREKAEVRLQLAQKKITPEQAAQMNLAAEGRAAKRKETEVNRAAGNRQWLLAGAISRTKQEIAKAGAEAPSEDELAQAMADEKLFEAAAKDEADTFQQREKAAQQALEKAQAASGMSWDPAAKKSSGTEFGECSPRA